jgi:YD repeat-containing protein
LVSENNGHGTTTNYTLDGPGNIVSETGASTRSYTYTNNFQLPS